MNKCSKSNYIHALILRSAQNANILPLTSTCNVNCVFCSNRQNPQGVEVYNVSAMDLDDIRECLDFMDKTRPVVIGESVTRVSEGEPFIHTNIREILSLLRERMPDTTIQITTNGILLREEMISFLSEIGNVTIYLSLNTAEPHLRGSMMGDKFAGTTISNVKLLKDAGINFHGSLVAMPHLYGYDDLKKTIFFLDRHKAQTIRVFIPGYTRLASRMLTFSPEMPKKVRRIVTELSLQVNAPVTCEPPELEDLVPEIAGVIKESPAKQAGIRSGDIIKDINGYQPYSRVDAFNILLQKSSPVVVFQRKGKDFRCILDKESGKAPGVVMEYDLSPVLKGVKECSDKLKAERVLVVTSTLAGKMVHLGMKVFCEGVDWRIVPVRNRFFGGTVGAAGLLVVEDMLESIKSFLRENPRWSPDLIILPPDAFDYRGRDLTGRSYLEVGEKTGVQVKTLI